jgi:hypothetical protein
VENRCRASSIDRPSDGTPEFRQGLATRTHEDQGIGPCWPNRPTLKVRRDSAVRRATFALVPPTHPQGARGKPPQNLRLSAPATAAENVWRRTDWSSSRFLSNHSPRQCSPRISAGLAMVRGLSLILRERNEGGQRSPGAVSLRGLGLGRFSLQGLSRCFSCMRLDLSSAPVR